MICHRCLRAAARSSTTSQTLRPMNQRLFSRTATTSQTPISPNVATQSTPSPAPTSSSHQPPTATSTSAAQPFSAHQTPSGIKAKKERAPPIPRSSAPAGTVLRGLNIIKGKQDPLALKDEEYPAWLWQLLVEKKGQEDKNATEGEGDLYGKTLLDGLVI